VVLEGANHLSTGDIVSVEIDHAEEYDLWGTLSD